MTDWKQGTTFEEAAERELLEVIRSGGDLGLTISCDPERPASCRWGIAGVGETRFGPTFASAWAGRKAGA